MQNLVDRNLVGLCEDELCRRMRMHRGVYCQRGLLEPTTTTLYHACLAQNFNSQLPFGSQPADASVAADGHSADTYKASPPGGSAVGASSSTNNASELSSAEPASSPMTVVAPLGLNEEDIVDVALTTPSTTLTESSDRTGASTAASFTGENADGGDAFLNEVGSKSKGGDGAMSGSPVDEGYSATNVTGMKPHAISSAFESTHKRICGGEVRRYIGHDIVPGEGQQSGPGADSSGILAFRTIESLQSYLDRAHAKTKGCFYVLQLEIDLMIPAIAAYTTEVPRDHTGDGTTSDPAQSVQLDCILVKGPVNVEAITRIWLAQRESPHGQYGSFINVAPP